MARHPVRSASTTRQLLLAAAGIVVAVTLPELRAQLGAEKPPAFDVVSVKPRPLPPNTFMFRSSGQEIEVHGDRYRGEAMTLSWLIVDAYHIRNYQISGLPQWGDGPQADRFDVDAKSDGTPTVARLRQMLQTLLADRFQLKVHWETKELPVYRLVIGKNGSKLRAVAGDPPEQEAEPGPARKNVPPKSLTGTIPELIDLLALGLDHPVVDHTSLSGKYEYANLKWGQFARQLRSGLTDPEGQSIFTAVQQELGLKLEPGKDPIEVLIVDRVRKPTAN